MLVNTFSGGGQKCVGKERKATCCIQVNSFKWGSCRPPEVSPRPHAKFIHYIYLTSFYISSVASGSCLCWIIDPRCVSYLEHCTCRI